MWGPAPTLGPRCLQGWQVRGHSGSDVSFMTAVPRKPGTFSELRHPSRCFRLKGLWLFLTQC